MVLIPSASQRFANVLLSPTLIMPKYSPLPIRKPISPSLPLRLSRWSCAPEILLLNIRESISWYTSCAVNPCWPRRYLNERVKIGLLPTSTNPSEPFRMLSMFSIASSVFDMNCWKNFRIKTISLTSWVPIDLSAFTEPPTNTANGFSIMNGFSASLLSLNNFNCS